MLGFRAIRLLQNVDTEKKNVGLLQLMMKKIPLTDQNKMKK